MKKIFALVIMLASIPVFSYPIFETINKEETKLVETNSGFYVYKYDTGNETIWYRYFNDSHFLNGYVVDSNGSIKAYIYNRDKKENYRYSLEYTDGKTRIVADKEYYINITLDTPLTKRSASDILSDLYTLNIYYIKNKEILAKDLKACNYNLDLLMSYFYTNCKG